MRGLSLLVSAILCWIHGMRVAAHDSKSDKWTHDTRNQVQTVFRSSSQPETSVFVKGGKFKMGVNDPTSRTGEYPVRMAEVKSFFIDKYPVTVGDFAQFRRSKVKYRTEPERTGYSWVFFSRAPRFAERNLTVVHPVGERWWLAVKGATWNRPYGPGSHVAKMADYPAVHVSLHDAAAFCAWAGKRLPTEYEWEYAARGGHSGQRFPWGDGFKPRRMNVWQGLFPVDNKRYDGWEGLSPVNAFPPQNEYGLYDMVGNTWEWTVSQYRDPQPARLAERGQHQVVLRGGSFIDSRDGVVNHEARCATRTGFPPAYTAENVGFRCVKSMILPSEVSDEIKRKEKEKKEKERKEKEREERARRVPTTHYLNETWLYKTGRIAHVILDGITHAKRKGVMVDEL